MGNMITHPASESSNAQRQYETSPFFGTPVLSDGSGTSEIIWNCGSDKSSFSPSSSGTSSILISPPILWSTESCSSPQNGAQRRWHCSKVGLGIINSITGDKEPLGEDFKSLKSYNGVFGPQLKINIPTSSSHFSEYSSLDPSHEINPISLNSMPLQPMNFSENKHIEIEVISPPIIDECSLGYASITNTGHETPPSLTSSTNSGPNHKVAHIFGDSLLECHTIEKSKELVSESHQCPLDGFLSICYTCKRKLEEGKDIYIYRGDASFCSNECRNMEIMAEKTKKAAEKSSKSSPMSNDHEVDHLHLESNTHYQ